MFILWQILEWAPVVIAVASGVAAATPTQKDNKVLGKAQKVLDFLALNIGKAKDR